VGDGTGQEVVPFCPKEHHIAWRHVYVLPQIGPAFSNTNSPHGRCGLSESLFQYFEVRAKERAVLIERDVGVDRALEVPLRVSVANRLENDSIHKRYSLLSRCVLPSVGVFREQSWPLHGCELCIVLSSASSSLCHGAGQRSGR
jgi:hypothetical protein